MKPGPYLVSGTVNNSWGYSQQSFVVLAPQLPAPPMQSSAQQRQKPPEQAPSQHSALAVQDAPTLLHAVQLTVAPGTGVMGTPFGPAGLAQRKPAQQFWDPGP